MTKLVNFHVPRGGDLSKWKAERVYPGELECEQDASVGHTKHRAHGIDRETEAPIQSHGKPAWVWFQIRLLVWVKERRTAAKENAILGFHGLWRHSRLIEQAC